MQQDKFFQNKRGMSAYFLVGVIMVVIALAVVLIFYFTIYNKDTMDLKRTVCQTSVRVASGPGVNKVLPLQCQTENVCIAESQGILGMNTKNCNASFGSINAEDIVKIKVSGATKDEIEQQIKKELADRMYRCWDMMGRGKLNFMGKGAFASTYSYCFECSRISFDPKIKEDFGSNILGEDKTIGTWIYDEKTNELIRTPKRDYKLVVGLDNNKDPSEIRYVSTLTDNKGIFVGRIYDDVGENKISYDLNAVVQNQNNAIPVNDLFNLDIDLKELRDNPSVIFSDGYILRPYNGDYMSPLYYIDFKQGDVTIDTQFYYQNNRIFYVIDSVNFIEVGNVQSNQLKFDSDASQKIAEKISGEKLSNANKFISDLNNRYAVGLRLSPTQPSASDTNLGAANINSNLPTNVGNSQIIFEITYGGFVGLFKNHVFLKWSPEKGWRWSQSKEGEYNRGDEIRLDKSYSILPSTWNNYYDGLDRLILMSKNHKLSLNIYFPGNAKPTAIPYTSNDLEDVTALNKKITEDMKINYGGIKDFEFYLFKEKVPNSDKNYMDTFVSSSTTPARVDFVDPIKVNGELKTVYSNEGFKDKDKLNSEVVDSAKSSSVINPAYDYSVIYVVSKPAYIMDWKMLVGGGAFVVGTGVAIFLAVPSGGTSIGAWALAVGAAATVKLATYSAIAGGGLMAWSYLSKGDDAEYRVVFVPHKTETLSAIGCNSFETYR